MSQDLLDGIPIGLNAGSLHVQGDLRAPEGSTGEGVYQELFRIDTGATESIAPASELEKIGIVPIGRSMYQLPDGTVSEYSFGLARIEFMGEMKEGRIIFGPEDIKPILGTSALESIGFTVDSASQTLKRIAAIEGAGQQ
jgi:predicted aspartyl protease